MSNHKIAIIGCGGMGSVHLDAYTTAGYKVSAVVDSYSEAAKALSEKAGGVSCYTDYKEMFEQEKPDIVSICTPPISHEEPVVMAMERGINVLCEKPMAYDIPSAYRIREAVNASSALMMPAFRHRFIDANQKMKETIASGELGDIVAFHNVFAGPAFGMEDKWFAKKDIAGGGCILDTSSHSVDIFRYLIGEITEQTAVMHQHFKTTDVEDAGILCVKAENGALGCMSSSFVYGDGLAFIDIVGTKGRIRYDYLIPDKLRYKLTDDAEWTEIDVAANWGFVEEINHFVDAVDGNIQPAISVEDGVRATEVICSIY